MINFKKIISVTPALICFSTITHAANLSGADISVCQSYLDALHSGVTLSDAQKKQANSALEKCLTNNPGGCSNFPNSPNCANIKSKMDLLGHAIPTPTPAPNTALPPAPSPIQMNKTAPATPQSQPINPNNGASQTYSTPPSNDGKSTTQPTNKKNDQTVPYSYF